MDEARLSVCVRPGARRNQLTGVRDRLVDAGVTVPGTGAKANAIVIGLLSHRLRVDAERITIVSGGESRIKQVRIETLSQSVADARLLGLSRDARRRRRRRARAAGMVAVGVVAVGIGIASASGGSVTRRAAARTGHAGVVARHRASHAGVVARHRAGRRRHLHVRRPRPDPGRLPQTARLPSAGTHEFAVRMRGLWAAITGAPIASARAAFFPEAAYVQLKSVADPAADFTYRLFYDYRLDIAAAHALLGSDARATRLVRTTAVAGYAHYVPPGVCDNRVGYYEQPNARLVYRERGQLRSIGIASLISWRGVWYVVHLGAVVRGSAGGVVNAPSAGPGVSSDAGTC